ncbi:RagB/SusD family nutrient uptake outer membrane protein [Arachidicoccus ginsenosidivorans]|uniref:RagB/SusD family nutrient uptake outer membrane protein n=1 Tax=Arachidicoccus ginsenosidivorans TaxID=496057 RepID=A0A5B8VJZ7_9BACT|nr:RagB/SusD family nutrient uptake outer membrane protein [Arachidicoccus ginsenosidivorans]QEC71877.1 RagB/SusD family nutrient uptake outer membrane protein [Arachidicoccus ginsenosidivorans]
MTKYIKYIFSATIIILLGTACNKWLTVKPQDGLIRDDYWQTKEQFEAAVVGCYSSLLNGNLVTDLFAWGEIRADMVTSTLRTPDDAVNMMQDNILPSNSFTDWSAIYKVINNCNTVLQYGPDVISRDATLTDSLQNNYLAEAHALRGLMYFYLLRTFGEVPLQLTAVSTDAEVQQLEKSSKQDVYNLVMSDFKFAEQYAVRSFGNNDKNKGRITKYAVFAMEADAYLWQDKYDSCVIACDSVINSGRYSLVPGTTQTGWFNDLYYTGNSPEGIFEFQFDAQALNPFYNMFISSSNQYVASTDYLSQNIYGLDQTGLEADIRGNNGSYVGTNGVILKYAGTNAGEDYTLRTSDESYAHWIVYRYADVLLMKAEALCFVNRGQEALDLIKLVRDRGQAIDLTEKAPDPSATDDIAKYVLDERAREFSFEGKRWFDLLRYAKRNNYQNLNELSSAAIVNAPANMVQTILNKYKDVNSLYLPINADELLADKKLVQNPFYTN